MSRTAGRLAFSLLGVLVSAVAGGLLPGISSMAEAADGKDLLLRVGVVAVEKNYHGRKLVIDFSRLTPQVTKFTVVYQLDGKERRENHSSKSVVVIDGDYFYQYDSQKRLVIKRKLPGEGGYDALRKESLKQALISYGLQSSPSDKIAGRRTRLYEFRPRQPGTRPVRKIWVDVETGLVLRMEIFNSDERLYWLSVFEHIEYRPTVSPANFIMAIPADARVVESKEGRCLSKEEAEKIAEGPLSLPGYLPGGFVRRCIRARRSADHGEVQVLYSDGLSLLSLFQNSNIKNSRRNGGTGSASVKIGDYEGNFHRVGLVGALSWQSSLAHHALLGEISRKELLKVAASVLPSRELSRP